MHADSSQLLTPARLARCFLLVLLLAILGSAVGCAPSPPQLPPSADPAAVADIVNGEGGQDFLREITSFAWDDDGRTAAEVFAWIPRDANSTDSTTATRAATTARSIATFLADTPKPADAESTDQQPANPALWHAYSATLVPYLGAMVGGDDVTGFKPVDGLESRMPNTKTLFGTLITQDGDDHTFRDAADHQALAYEQAFAKAVIADPESPLSEQAHRDLLGAARLRALTDTGEQLADPGTESVLPGRVRTQLAFEIAALTARPGDPHIENRFFGSDGKLLSPSAIDNDDWSMYDTELVLSLGSNKVASDALWEFGRAYRRIANG